MSLSKYQLPTLHGFRDIARTRFYRLRSLLQGQMSNQCHHDVAHLHPLTNVPTKYPLPIPDSFQDIAQTRFYRSWSKVKLRPPHGVAHLNQCPFQVSTSYTLRFPRYSPDKIL